MTNDNQLSPPGCSTPPDKPPSGRWAKVGLRLFVSTGLIGFIFYKTDLAAFIHHLISVDIVAAIFAIAVFQFQGIIGGLRWGAVLHAIGVSFRYARVIALFFIGYFFGQALPSSVGGDVIRVYEFYKDGHSLTDSVSGVLLDRVSSVIMLIILVLAMQPYFIANINAAQQEWVQPVIILFFVFITFGLFIFLFAERLPFRDSRIVRSFLQIAINLQRLTTSARSLAIVGVLALAGHLNTTLGVYILAYGLGIEVSFLDCLMLMPLVVLVTTLPISIAGWGIREMAMITAFGMIGLPTEPVFVLSVMIGLANLLVGFSGFLFWLAYQRPVD